MKNSLIILSVILCLLTNDLFGQRNKIIGIVLDSNTNNPICWARVYLKQNDIIINHVITNENGKFLLKKIKKGKYTIEVSGVGYASINYYKIDVAKSKQFLRLYLKDYIKPESVFEMTK